MDSKLVRIDILERTIKKLQSENDELRKKLAKYITSDENMRLEIAEMKRIILEVEEELRFHYWYRGETYKHQFNP